MPLNTDGNQRNGRPTMGLPTRRVQFFEYIAEHKVISPGSTSFTPTLHGPPIADVGPYVESLTVHANVLEASDSSFTYKFGIQYSDDTLNWSDLVDIGSYRADNGPFVVQHTTTTDFGRYFRVELLLKDDGTVRTARMRVWVALKFWSQ